MMQVLKVWLWQTPRCERPSVLTLAFFRDPHMTKHSSVYWLVNLKKSIDILQKLAYLKPPYSIKTGIQISRPLYDFRLKIQHMDVKGTDTEHMKK